VRSRMELLPPKAPQPGPAFETAVSADVSLQSPSRRPPSAARSDGGRKRHWPWAAFSRNRIDEPSISGRHPSPPPPPPPPPTHTTPPPHTATPPHHPPPPPPPPRPRGCQPCSARVAVTSFSEVLLWQSSPFRWRRRHQGLDHIVDRRESSASSALGSASPPYEASSSGEPCSTRRPVSDHITRSIAGFRDVVSDQSKVASRQNLTHLA